MSNLVVRIDTGSGWVAQNVGVDFINDFTTDDILYNYQESSIRFENPLIDGDRIEFSGNRKIPVIAQAEDPVSIAQFGIRSKLIRDNSIEDLSLARKRAQAELVRFKDGLTDISFTTRDAGLNVGMTMSVLNTERGIDADYIIQRLTFTTIDPNTFNYRIQLVNTRSQKFQELLAKLLDPQLNDETEVSQVLKADIQTVAVSEVIQSVSPVTNDDTVSIAETIWNDPLGAGVEPTWVLGYYVPNPYPTDTKRQGFLGISMKLY